MKTVNSKQYIVNSWGLRFFIFVFSLFTVYCLLSTATLAQTEYKLLAPLPGYVKTTAGGKTTAGPYIEGIFILIIAIATGLAVLKIIFGGIKYMSTDAFGEKNEAKTTIQNAIWGLLLAISAWLILFTVNPNLIKLNLIIPVQPIATTSPGGGGGPSDLGLTQQQAMSAFRSAGVGIASGINLAGIRQGTVDEVTRLKVTCNCAVIVTSATGGEHAPGTCSHANGYKVDLGLNDKLTNYIERNYRRNPDRSDGARIYTSPTNGVYALESDHWDVARCN